jgi:hypothetical protein
VINISGLGESDDRVNEQVSLALTGSTDSQLTMGTMHGVTGLESNNAGPLKLLEVSTKFSRGIYI